ncbi:MAG TPA: hypothetical protein VJV74_09815, partial [Terriglobia bacterium]|nr:hypothetical protein [Terriglobia bacterium]
MKVRARLAIAVVLACCPVAVAQGPIRQRLSSVDWAPYQDQAIHLLQDYLRIDTSNPPGNEHLAAD